MFSDSPSVPFKDSCTFNLNVVLSRGNHTLGTIQQITFTYTSSRPYYTTEVAIPLLSSSLYTFMEVYSGSYSLETLGIRL